MRVRAVIFDLDGVILDSAPAALKILADIAQEENLKLEMKNKIHWGLSGRIILEKLLPGASLRTKVKVYRKWRNKERKRLIPLFPNVLEVISTLKEKGMITGLLTNRNVRPVRFLGRRENIDYKNLFDFIQTKGNWWELFKKKIHPNHFFSYIYKPDKGCFAPALKFLGKSGIKRGEVIYVGDAIVDSIASQQAGVGFIAIIGHGPLNRKDFEFQQVKYILDSIEELPGLLDKI